MKEWHAEALRLKAEGVPIREICRRFGKSLGTLAVVLYPKARESKQARVRVRSKLHRDDLALLRAEISTISARLVEATEERERLREALRPFVLPTGYGDLDTDAPDEGPIMTTYGPGVYPNQPEHVIRRGDFRRARAALTHADAGRRALAEAEQEAGDGR